MRKRPVFADTSPVNRTAVNSDKLSSRKPTPSQSGAAGASAKGAATPKRVEKSTDVFPVAVVDDDENQRLFIKSMLDQTPGFSCVGSYSSGEAALTGIPGSGAKLVLMDIRMPGMS